MRNLLQCPLPINYHFDQETSVTVNGILHFSHFLFIECIVITPRDKGSFVGLDQWIRGGGGVGGRKYII